MFLPAFIDYDYKRSDKSFYSTKSLSRIGSLREFRWFALKYLFGLYPNILENWEWRCPPSPWLHAWWQPYSNCGLQTSARNREWAKFMCTPSVFLSRFWVSKWHPKILKWHPKFWKPRYGFALYWSKTIWEACFPARGYCNRRLQCYRPTQFSTAEIGSENCKFGICASSCAPLRFGLNYYCRRFVQ